MAEYEPPGIREELAVGWLRVQIACHEAREGMRALAETTDALTQAVADEHEES